MEPADAGPEDEGFKKCRKHRKTRIGEKPDGHGRYADRFEKQDPVGGQDQSLEEKQAAVGFPLDGKTAAGEKEDCGQDRSGEDDPSQDDEKGRESQPLAEESGQSEKRRRGVNGEKTPGTVQSAPIISKKRFSARAVCVKLPCILRRRIFLRDTPGSVHVQPKLYRLGPKIPADDVRGDGRPQKRSSRPSRTPSGAVGSPRPTCFWNTRGRQDDCGADSGRRP